MFDMWPMIKTEKNVQRFGDNSLNIENQGTKKVKPLVFQENANLCHKKGTEFK